jgi:tetratricopeptide (TPR) repeat protein
MSLSNLSSVPIILFALKIKAGKRKKDKNSESKFFSRFHILLFPIVALIFLAIFGSYLIFRPKGLFNGVYPLEKIDLAEDDNESIFVWLRNDFRNYTVVNFDTHDDYRFISKDKIKNLRKLAQQKKIDLIRQQSQNIGASDLFHLGNWLYAAAQIGITSDIIWVASYPVKERGLTFTTGLLNRFRYPKGDILTFREEESGMKGKLLGYSFEITDLEHFTPPKQPFLLNIDVDYLHTLARERGENVMEAYLYFKEKIRKAKLNPAFITIAYSVHADYLPMEQKYLGKLLKLSLVKPSKGKRYEEVWFEIEKARENRNFDLITSKLIELQDDPIFSSDALTQLSFLQAGQGNFVAAKQLIDEAIEKDSSYSYALIVIGQELAFQGNMAGAEPFFKEALEKAPPFLARLRYADSLYNNGYYLEALPLYQELLSYGQNIDVFFYLGDTYFELGKVKEAEKYYLKGEKLLASETYKQWSDYPISLINLTKLYLDRGEKKKAFVYFKFLSELSLPENLRGEVKKLGNKFD